MPDSEGGRALILDADGVFMDERPYWEAALGTALLRAGLAADVDGRWDLMASIAFGALGLQCVAKLRGCNSNWDLAAVLEKALEDRSARDDVRRRLRSADLRSALLRLREAAESVGDPGMTAPDPLSTFGIERESATFAQTCESYQQVLFGLAGIDWPIQRVRLREPRSEVVGALESCRSLGFDLRVCTGRSRSEIAGPLEALGLSPLLPTSGVTSADEVARAEAETGLRGLGKPHAFPVLCAVLGYAEARDRLTAGVEASPSGTTDTSVFVGDGWSDYLAVSAARGRGIVLDYIHVRSSLVTPDQLERIAATPFCLGIVDRLGELSPLLNHVSA